MHRVLILLIATSVGLIAANESAMATPPAFHTCYGYPVMWVPNQTLTLKTDTCSISPWSNAGIAASYAIAAWDDRVDLIDQYGTSTDCEYTKGDGDSEVLLVDRDEELDATVHGVVWSTYTCGSPFAPLPIYSEADVLIADDLDFTDPTATALSDDDPVPGLGRLVFTHEMGHFFGFGHDSSGVHTMMLPGDFETFPTVGGTPSTVLWPSDVEGLEEYYGVNSSLPNLVVSSQDVKAFSPFTVADLNPIMGIGCPGADRSLKIYVGNTGKTSTGTFSGRVYLTKPSPSSSGGTTVATFTDSLGAFDEDAELAVSYSLPELSGSFTNGLYYVNIYLDHTGSISETSNNDNWTILVQRLLVDSTHAVCQ